MLFDKAEDNVRDSERIKELVENYRKALVMHVSREIIDCQKRKFYTESILTG